MSASQRLHDDLGEPRADEFGDYQPISRLALAGLFVGLLSIVSLLAIPLSLVPAVGIMLSCLALAHINRAAGMIRGRRLALAGLALSVFFASAALADYWQTRRLLAREAELASDDWFAALARGEPEFAHQWTRPLLRRAGLSDLEQLKNHYETDEKRQNDLAAFIKSEPAARLLELGTHAHAKLEQVKAIDDPAGFVTLRYRVTTDDAREPPFTIDVLLEHAVILGQTERQWVVVSCKAVDPDPGAATK